MYQIIKTEHLKLTYVINQYLNKAENFLKKWKAKKKKKKKKKAVTIGYGLNCLPTPPNWLNSLASQPSYQNGAPTTS